VIDVIRAIRKEVSSSSFCAGIKQNPAVVGGSEGLEESLEQVDLIAKEKIEFLEISRGSYEHTPTAFGDNLAQMKSSKWEAFFLDYARAVRARYSQILLMVTGGFRTRAGIIAAMKSNACDLIRLARPAAAFPHLPRYVLLNENVNDGNVVVDLAKVQGYWLRKMIPMETINAGIDTVTLVSPIPVLRRLNPP
jgi:2,4-dienoyl-CoA reductase-like NADH-dependent reductase (Old Yellow Enzyme family)